MFFIFIVCFSRSSFVGCLSSLRVLSPQFPVLICLSRQSQVSLYMLVPGQIHFSSCFTPGLPVSLPCQQQSLYIQQLHPMSLGPPEALQASLPHPGEVWGRGRKQKLQEEKAAWTNCWQQQKSDGSDTPPRRLGDAINEPLGGCMWSVSWTP